MLGLWTLVSAGEQWTDEAKHKRIRFWVDTGLLGEARTGGHPAYLSPFVEPWEVLALLKEIAAALNANHAAQRQMLEAR